MSNLTSSILNLFFVLDVTIPNWGEEVKFHSALMFDFLVPEILKYMPIETPEDIITAVPAVPAFLEQGVPVCPAPTWWAGPHASGVPPQLPEATGPSASRLRLFISEIPILLCGVPASALYWSLPDDSRYIPGTQIPPHTFNTTSMGS